jgi:hypothetical protein
MDLLVGEVGGCVVERALVGTGLPLRNLELRRRTRQHEAWVRRVVGDRRRIILLEVAQCLTAQPDPGPRNYPQAVSSKQFAKIDELRYLARAGERVQRLGRPNCRAVRLPLVAKCFEFFQ